MYTFVMHLNLTKIKHLAKISWFITNFFLQGYSLSCVDKPVNFFILKIQQLIKIIIAENVSNL